MLRILLLKCANMNVHRGQCRLELFELPFPCTQLSVLLIITPSFWHMNFDELQKEGSLRSPNITHILQIGKMKSTGEKSFAQSFKAHQLSEPMPALSSLGLFAQFHTPLSLGTKEKAVSTVEVHGGVGGQETKKSKKALSSQRLQRHHLMMKPYKSQ